MFCIEFLLNTELIKEKINIKNKIGWLERTMGILFWPVWLVIFLYNFFKEYFK